MARSGSQERTKGASQQAHGRLKEAIGALSGNRCQARQGRVDQARGRLRERWGHLKDALHRQRPSPDPGPRLLQESSQFAGKKS